jgi:hypothetical protein
VATLVPSILISPYTKGYSWLPWISPVRTRSTHIYTVKPTPSRIFYVNLAPDQQAVYELLIADGVLPDTHETMR